VPTPDGGSSISAGANRNDAPLLGPTLAAAKLQVNALPRGTNVNLDRGYDSAVTRALLDELGFSATIARKGVPAPIQAGRRWVVERTHSWMNDYGKLRRCTEKDARVVDFYLYLAAALVPLRMLIRRATKRYRWDGRPTTRRLKLSKLPARSCYLIMLRVEDGLPQPIRQGVIVTDVPEVVLVCAHYANRRQIAAALLDHYANGRVQPVQVRLTGTEPADQSSPAVVAAVAEGGIALSEQFPKPLAVMVERPA
jgi:Transposase DDE domain